MYVFKNEFHILKKIIVQSYPITNKYVTSIYTAMQLYCLSWASSNQAENKSTMNALVDDCVELKLVI